MTSSQERSFFSEIERGEPIPKHKLAYLHARASSEFYDYIVGKFREAAKANNLTQAQLARRIDKPPEVVNRLLSSPGNWTLETISSLLAGICAEKIDPHSSSLINRRRRNIQPDDLMKPPQIVKTGGGAKVDIAPFEIRT